MSKPLRTLRPAPQQEESSSTASETPTFELPKHSNRIGNRNACEECRLRKRKCTRERPRCHHCVKRGLRKCVYMDDFEREAALGVIKILQALPIDRAHHVLERLRHSDSAVSDLSTILNASSSKPVQSHPQEHTRERSPFPSLEEELTALSPVAYPLLQPISPTTLQKSNLLGPIQDALNSPAQGVDLDPIGEEKQETQTMDRDSAVRRFDSSKTPANSEEPIHQYYNSHLSSLDISYWTDVDIPNNFATRVITLYLCTDHPMLGTFDPHLFVQDLVGHRTTYCSRLLVHAILYLGCQMYNAFDRDAAQYIEELSTETLALAAEARNHSSPLNIAALSLVSLSLISHGRDHVVLEYAELAVKMGEHLGLFKHDSGRAIDMERASAEQVRMHSHAAWGAFCWGVFIALFYRQPHSHVPSSTPSLPMPGSPSFPQLGPEHDITIPQDEALMGSAFHSLCQFWLIIHDGLWIYYSDWPQAPPEAFRAALAEHKYREILAWTNKIPSALVRDENSGPHVPVFQFSIWLHAALLDIARPFTSDTPGTLQPWKTFVAPDSSANAAYSASVKQLKRLILEYRDNYKASTYSILWHTGLLYLTNAILESPRDPEWHLYFLLCIYGYESLRRPYSVSASIGRSLLVMALRDTEMSGEEARKILRQLEHQHLSQVKDHLHANFMADLKMAQSDPEKAQVENMAKDFHGLALFNDYIQEDNMDEAE